MMFSTIAALGTSRVEIATVKPSFAAALLARDCLLTHGKNIEACMREFVKGVDSAEATPAEFDESTIEQTGLAVEMLADHLDKLSAQLRWLRDSLR